MRLINLNLESGPGLPEGAGVTIASWLLRIGFLGASPLIGFVSDLTSLRVALAILALGGLAVLVLSGKAAPARTDAA